MTSETQTDPRHAVIADWLYRTFRVVPSEDFPPQGDLLASLGCGADGCEAGWVWPTPDPADRFPCNDCAPAALTVSRHSFDFPKMDPIRRSKREA